MSEPTIDIGNEPAPQPAADPAPAPAPAPEGPHHADPAPTGSKTLLEEEPADKAPREGDLWARWREDMAGGDEEAAKQIARYASPQNVWKALRDAQNKIRSGQFKRTLADDASPEELAAWRKDNGVPEKPEDYSLDLSGGKVVGDQDKPALQKILAAAHAGNVPQRGVSAIVDAYYDHVENEAAQRSIRDGQYKADAEDKLRADWGPDYRVNLGLAENLLAQAPEGLASRLLGGRTADGRILGNDPDFLKFLASVARDINPVPTMVPSGGQSVTETIQGRLEQIRQMQKSEPNKYWGNTKIQEEELKLLEALERQKGRAA